MRLCPEHTNNRRVHNQNTHIIGVFMTRTHRVRTCPNPEPSQQKVDVFQSRINEQWMPSCPEHMWICSSQEKTCSGCVHFQNIQIADVFQSRKNRQWRCSECSGCADNECDKVYNTQIMNEFNCGTCKYPICFFELTGINSPLHKI